MHFVVLHDYQGADSSSEQQLTDQLLDAALSELAVVAGGQPCLLVSVFNVEPTKILSLAKGISAGLWVDLEASWATASEREPVVAWKRTWASDSGHLVEIFRFDALCPVGSFSERWVQPHLAVRSWFAAERWSGCVTQPCRFTSLWPVSCLTALDKSRDPKSAEVRRVWGIYDERLDLVSVDDTLRLDAALGEGDVSKAWIVWSGAALVGADCLASGPERGFKVGRGSARFCRVKTWLSQAS